jgi:hypothetical protein
MKKLLLIIALATIMAIVACSDNKPNNSNPPPTSAVTVWDSTGGFWRSTVDGSSYTSFKYFSFGSKDTVSITDDQALTDTSWDIAFGRTVAKINGGVSGSKDNMGVDLAAVMPPFPDSVDFDAITDTTGVRMHNWQSDYYDFAVGDWYAYNYPNVNPTNYVYTLKDAVGKYVKFTVSGMYGGSNPPNMGSIVFKYVYADSGTDISGAGITDTLTVGSDTAYFDFSTGARVTPADPYTSLDWDFAVASYDIHLNSNLFGPGVAAAYLNTDDSNNPRTDFDSIVLAETQPQAYSWDEAGSAFSGWYEYDDVTHQLASKSHVYLVKVGADIYKMQILSYYSNINGTPTSGWYTFKWLKLAL